MEEPLNDIDNKQDDENSYPPRPGLQKSLKNRVIWGICGGIGEYFDVEPFIIRLLFLLSIFFGGWGIVIYIIAAIAIPSSKQKEIETEFDYPRLKAFIGFTLIFIGIFLILERTRFIFNDFFGLSYELFIPFLLFIMGFMFFMVSVKIDEPKTTHLLVLSKSDYRIGGVCGGLARYFNADSSMLRFQWVIFTIFTLGAGVIIYILFMFLVPKEEFEIAEKD